jgi:hypothetical protein
MFLSDGSQHIVRGTERYAVSPSGTVLATERFTTPIISSVAVDRGWVFVTGDGSLYRATSFLATPEGIGRFTCPFHTALHTVGRAVLIDAAGGLWTTDGAGPPVRTWLDGKVLHAAFQDGVHGAAVMDDGRLLLTVDGGARWTPFALGAEVAWDTSLVAEGVMVETTTGTRIVRWSREGTSLIPGTALGVRSPVQVELDTSPRWARAIPPVEAQSACTWRIQPPGPEVLPRRRYLCGPGPLVSTPEPSHDGRWLLGDPVSARAGAEWSRTWHDEHGDSRMRVGWRGADEAGEYTATTDPQGVGLEGAFGHGIQPTGESFLAASRRGALLLLVRSEARGYTNVLAWGRTDGTFTVVESSLVRGSGHDRLGSMATPDGGVVFLRGLHGSHAEISWERASAGFVRSTPYVGMSWRLDASGSIVSRRGFLTYGAGSPWVGRVRDHAGPVVRRPDDQHRLWLLPLDGSTPRSLPATRWDEAPTCVEVDPNAAVVDVMRAPIDLIQEHPETGREIASEVVDAEIEVHETHACIRWASTQWQRWPLDRQSLVVAMSGRAGDRFEGSMHCRPAPPVPRPGS